jgi:hypothetical protein
VSVKLAKVFKRRPSNTTHLGIYIDGRYSYTLCSHLNSFGVLKNSPNEVNCEKCMRIAKKKYGVEEYD